MENEAPASDAGFGLKEHDELFRAALKIATWNGQIIRARTRREADGMSIEVALDFPDPTRRRKRGTRRKKPTSTFSVMICERGTVVFDAVSSWPKKGGKKRGYVRTYVDGLWRLRLMRKARAHDYLDAVSSQAFRKALALLVESTEPDAPMPSEAARAATDVIRRRFEPEKLEVRRFRMLMPERPDASFRVVKVLHDGQEVYEAVYAHDPAGPPDRPKLTLRMETGGWRETLQTL